MTEPTDATPLNVIDLIRVVIDADNETRGFALRGTSNWAAHIGKAVQNAVLAKWGTPPAVAVEPVAWQSRTRPTWGDSTRPWSPWEPCTKGQAEDYWKAPLLHDWAYEARALYATPQPTQAQAGAVPLTDEQLWANDEIMSLNADLGWHMDAIRMFTRVIERAHGIKGGQHG